MEETSTARRYVTGTQIEIVNLVERGRLRHAIFDFDGTISLLREGWQRVMGPLMVEMICGDAQPTPEIAAAAEQFIEDTTGINTILQMEQLVDMVRSYGLVPADKILDAYGYKKIYNDRLMIEVNRRIERLSRGEMTIEEASVRGSIDFVRKLYEKGLTLYLASGTDHDDVRNESTLVGVAQYFTGGIYGALRTFAESNKEKVIRDIIQKNGLHGSEVLVCGDGPVEIRNAKSSGCIALGLASNEITGSGWDERKRQRLLRAGADILIADFSEIDALIAYLFPRG